MIKDSSELTQLFHKKRDNDKRILKKITIEPLSEPQLPNNLYGYNDSLKLYLVRQTGLEFGK